MQSDEKRLRIPLVPGKILDMQGEVFEGELLAGHQQNAIEVPFNPAAEWGVPAAGLWNGRKGHFAAVIINRVSFESVIVPRMKKFFLLVPDDICISAKIQVGRMVSVTIAPLAAPAAIRPPNL